MLFSGVNKSARERIGRQNLSQKVPSKKGSLGVIFSPRSCRENAHSKAANFEGRHSGGHLLGRPLLFTSDFHRPRKRNGKNRENPRTIPEQVGKIPEKSGKSQNRHKRTKKDKKGKTGPDRVTPPFETSPFSGS